VFWKNLGMINMIARNEKVLLNLFFSLELLES
jgi:hypothetical protein